MSSNETLSEFSLSSKYLQLRVLHLEKLQVGFSILRLLMIGEMQTTIILNVKSAVEMQKKIHQ